MSFIFFMSPLMEEVLTIYKTTGVSSISTESFLFYNNDTSSLCKITCGVPND